jgi:hypothetical protein
MDYIVLLPILRNCTAAMRKYPWILHWSNRREKELTLSRGPARRKCTPAPAFFIVTTIYDEPRN